MRAENGTQLSRDLVLIGGGHTHALVLRRFGMKPLPGTAVTLISPEPNAPYTGMLPGHVAGHYPLQALQIDLVRLARFAGARLIIAPATGIDPQAKRVLVSGRPPVPYDVLSIDVGIHGINPRIEGLAAYGVPAKPLGPFAAAWDRFVDQVRRGEAAPSCVVIGGGVAGTELAMAMAHRLRMAGTAPDVTLIEAGPDLPQGLSQPAARRLAAHLVRQGVSTRKNAPVAAVTPDAVTLESGETIPSAFTVGAAGATPYRWLRETGLRQEEGYLAVNAHLRVLGQDAVFAAGDCAHLTHAPREKAGVYAVREAPILAANLRAVLKGEPDSALESYMPQKGYLKLVSAGSKTAAFDKWGLAAHGSWVWRLKDRIDRAFMDKFHGLSPMKSQRPPEEAARGTLTRQPLCAGCGAKAGRGALIEAMGPLGDDAATLPHEAGHQVISTDTLRAFTEDPHILARIAAIHALGDVWAKGAKPQAAVLTATLPRMTPALQARRIEEVVAAVRAVLDAEGAALVGGHTATGAEASIGLTVTGLAASPIGQDGARPGDVLFITKPLGTGTILAGEMRLQAQGMDVAGALRSMERPQGRAAALLAEHAHAMTDVTGFGLAGHLLGMMEASGTGAVIDLERLPLLPGAERLAASGVRSSLFEDNVAAGTKRTPPPDTARTALFYDPQTAGGLLAAVPEDAAAAVEAAFAESNEPLWRIGIVAPGPVKITLSA